VAFEIGEEGVEALESGELGGRMEPSCEGGEPGVIVNGKGVHRPPADLGNDDRGGGEGNGSGDGSEGIDQGLAVILDPGQFLWGKIGVFDAVGENDAIPPTGCDPRGAINRVTPSIDYGAKTGMFKLLQLRERVLKDFIGETFEDLPGIAKPDKGKGRLFAINGEIHHEIVIL
jgi:hypothetical protein